MTTHEMLNRMLNSFCCSTFDLVELDAVESMIVDPIHRRIADAVRSHHPDNEI